MEHRETFVLVILFSLTLFLSTFHLTESPSVWYDEGIYSQAAFNISTIGVSGLQLFPGTITHISQITVGYPLIFPLSLVYRIFGFDVLYGRLVMITFLFLLVGAGSLVIWKNQKNRHSMALLSLALLVTYPVLYGNGKSVLGEVPGLFFLLVGIYGLYRQAESSGAHKNIWLIISGLAVGLALATKPIFLVLLPAVFIAVIVDLWRKNQTGRDICLFSLCLAIPFMLWIFLQFGDDVSFREMITFYANPNHVSNLFDLFLRNLKILFSSLTPLYLVFTIFIWSISIAVRIKRDGFKSDHVPAAELAAFIFCMLIILAFLRISGQFRYLFPAQIVALIYLVPSLFEVSGVMKNKLGNISDQARGSIVTVGIVILCLVGLHCLLFDSWVADYYGSHKTAFWQEYFERLPRATSVYFYNTPEVAIYDCSRNYYQYLEPAAQMKFGVETLDRIENGKVDKIIIPANYYKEDETLFSKYVLEQKAYKYLILKKM